MTYLTAMLTQVGIQHQMQEAGLTDAEKLQVLSDTFSNLSSYRLSLKEILGSNGEGRTNALEVDCISYGSFDPNNKTPEHPLLKNRTGNYIINPPSKIFYNENVFGGKRNEIISYYNELRDEFLHINPNFKPDDVYKNQGFENFLRDKQEKLASGLNVDLKAIENQPIELKDDPVISKDPTDISGPEGKKKVLEELKKGEFAYVITAMAETSVSDINAGINSFLDDKKEDNFYNKNKNAISSFLANEIAKLNKAMEGKEIVKIGDVTIDAKNKTREVVLKEIIEAEIKAADAEIENAKVKTQPKTEVFDPQVTQESKVPQPLAVDVKAASAKPTIKINPEGFGFKLAQTNTELTFISNLKENLAKIPAADQNDPAKVNAVISTAKTANIKANGSDAYKRVEKYRASNENYVGEDIAELQANVASVSEITAYLNAREPVAKAKLNEEVGKKILDAVDKDIDNVGKFFTALEGKLKPFEQKTKDSFSDRVCSSVLGIDSGSSHKFDKSVYENMPEFKDIKDPAIKEYLIEKMEVLYNKAAAQKNNDATTPPNRPYDVVISELNSIKSQAGKDLTAAKKYLEEQGFIVEPVKLEVALTHDNVKAVLGAMLENTDGKFSERVDATKVQGVFGKFANRLSSFGINGVDVGKISLEGGNLTVIRDPNPQIKLSDLGLSVSGDADRMLTKSEIVLFSKLFGKYADGGVANSIDENEAKEIAGYLGAMVDNFSASEQQYNIALNQGDKKGVNELSDKKDDKLLRELFEENPALKDALKGVSENSNALFNNIRGFGKMKSNAVGIE